ncbi:MAG: FtsH protease activity modulator HflK [Alphaproteobacteria bacterium]
MLRRGQEKLRNIMPGGIGGAGIFVLIALALVIWMATGIYRVQSDEQGVVLRFGEWNRTTPPGLHFAWPYPIETVDTPKVTRINRIEVGFRAVGDTVGRPEAGRQVPEEALMLTGDENIVDINFSVFWRISDAGKFLFNVRAPETTIKAVSESTMREMIGQTPIALALAEGRGKIELTVQERMQQTLDAYGAGVAVTQVQLLKVDPPSEVIDAFRDVQRARADQERLRNEAEAYRNDIIPRARGDAERLTQEAEAYRQEVVARSQGDAERFESVLVAYEAAKDVTARRIYLETLEEILRNANKVIIDNDVGGGQGVVPYLPLNELHRRPAPAPQQNEVRR